MTFEEYWEELKKNIGESPDGLKYFAKNVWDFRQIEIDELKNKMETIITWRRD